MSRVRVRPSTRTIRRLIRLTYSSASGLECRPANPGLRLVLLSLDVHSVETELVLIDHAVDTLIAGQLGNAQRRLVGRTPVTHRPEEFDHEALERLPWVSRRLEPVQHVRLDRTPRGDGL